MEIVLFLIKHKFSKTSYSKLVVVYNMEVVLSEVGAQCDGAWERTEGTQTINRPLKGNSSKEQGSLCLCRLGKFRDKKKLKLCCFCYLCGCSLSLCTKLREILKGLFSFIYKTASVMWSLRHGVTEGEKISLLLQKRNITLQTVNEES